MNQIYLQQFCPVLNFAVAQRQDYISDHLNPESKEITVKLKNDVSSGVSNKYMRECSTSKDLSELLELENKLKSSKVLRSDAFGKENLIFPPDPTLNISPGEAKKFNT